ELLAKQGDGMEFLSQCSPEELAAVKGVGTAKACQILSALELGKRMASRPISQRVTVDNPEAIAKLFMEEMRYYKKEVFLVLLINVKGQIITVDRASVGDLSSTVIHPREIFNLAVKRSAAAVILVHNHPSGNPFPSQDDMDTTKRLAEAGKILGINVLDHIIIGDGTYISFRKRQLIGD
ncbi:MAG: DNA repair protein RadC, partial [Anaerovorax sp.]